MSRNTLQFGVNNGSLLGGLLLALYLGLEMLVPVQAQGYYPNDTTQHLKYGQPNMHAAAPMTPLPNFGARTLQDPNAGMGMQQQMPAGGMAAAPMQMQPPSVMEQALSLHRAGRYADAVHLYESIIYQSAPDPRLYASVADAHFKLGNKSRALKYAVEALKLDPNYSSGHLLLGTILGDMGDDMRAVRSFQKVLILDQNNPYAYYNLGLLYYKKADMIRAMEYLEKAKQLNPNDPKIWNNLGVAFYDQGINAKALVAFSEALRLDPYFESAARNLELLKANMPPGSSPPPSSGSSTRKTTPKKTTTVRKSSSSQNSSVSDRIRRIRSRAASSSK